VQLDVNTLKKLLLKVNYLNELLEIKKNPELNK